MLKPRKAVLRITFLIGVNFCWCQFQFFSTTMFVLA